MKFWTVYKLLPYLWKYLPRGNLELWLAVLHDICCHGDNAEINSSVSLNCTDIWRLSLSHYKAAISTYLHLHSWWGWGKAVRFLNFVWRVKMYELNTVWLRLHKISTHLFNIMSHHIIYVLGNNIIINFTVGLWPNCGRLRKAAESTVSGLGYSFDWQTSKVAQEFWDIKEVVLSSQRQVLGGNRAIISRNLGVNPIFYSIPSVTIKDHGKAPHIRSEIGEGADRWSQMLTIM